MNEDDTFKKLKGLSFNEALKMYSDIFNTSMPINGSIETTYIIEQKLNEYNWTIDRLGKEFWKRGL